MSILNEFNKTKPAPAHTTSRQVYGSFAPLEDPRNGPIAAPTRPAPAAPPVVRTQTKPALASTGGMVGYQPEKNRLTPTPAPAGDMVHAQPGTVMRPTPAAPAPAPTRAPAAPPAVRANTKPTLTLRDIDQRGRANPLAGAGAGMQSKLAGAAAGMKSKMTGSRMPTLGPRKPGSR